MDTKARELARRAGYRVGCDSDLHTQWRRGFPRSLAQLGAGSRLAERNQLEDRLPIDAAIQVCADRGLRTAPIERVVRGDGALLEAARGSYARTRSARKAWEALARRADPRHARRRLSFKLISVSPRSTSRVPRGSASAPDRGRDRPRGAAVALAGPAPTAAGPAPTAAGLHVGSAGLGLLAGYMPLRNSQRWPSHSRTSWF
jgi:hypothetical protein